MRLLRTLVSIGVLAACGSDAPSAPAAAVLSPGAYAFSATIDPGGSRIGGTLLVTSATPQALTASWDVSTSMEPAQPGGSASPWRSSPDGEGYEVRARLRAPAGTATMIVRPAQFGRTGFEVRGDVRFDDGASGRVSGSLTALASAAAR